MTKLWVSTSNVLVDWTPLSSYFISQICDCLGRLRIYIKIQTVVQRTGQSILVYRLRIYLLTCVLQYKYLSHETCFPGSLYHLDLPCFTICWLLRQQIDQQVWSDDVKEKEAAYAVIYYTHCASISMKNKLTLNVTSCRQN